MDGAMFRGGIVVRAEDRPSVTRLCRSRALAGSLLLAGLLALSACGGSAPAARSTAANPSAPAAAGTSAQPAGKPSIQTIAYGILGATSSEWPVYVAEAKGFFKQQGVQ